MTTSCRRPERTRKTIEQIAGDFGIPDSCLANGCGQADDGRARRHDQRASRRDCERPKRRIRLLEQENEVLRRAAAYLSQANLPGKCSTRS